MIKSYTLAGLVCALFCILFGLSIYSGFSEKADVFCTGGPKTSKLAIGPDGLVVLWHRVLSISLVAEFSILVLLTLIAHSTYTDEKYEEFISNKNIQEASDRNKFPPQPHNPFMDEMPLHKAENDKTGNKLYDAFLIFETWKVNVFHLTSLLYIAFYTAWILFGLVIMRSFVPRECFNNHMGDKTVLTIMEVIVFLSIAPFVSSLFLLVLTSTT